MKLRRRERIKTAGMVSLSCKHAYLVLAARVVVLVSGLGVDGIVV